MSVLKRRAGGRRRMGRRVAVTGLGVALLVLGLEAPAFAAVSITGFTPTSGPDATVFGACVVVITGTNFDNPAATTVDFNGTSADFAIISGTEIWAAVPTGATDGPIHVDNPVDPPAASPSNFAVTTGPGGCAPTVTSFTPICGPAGTNVTVTGTNLLQGVDPVVGGDVRFAPYSGASTASPPATGTTMTPTEVTVDVPATVATGPIEVQTFFTGDGGLSGPSATSFTPGTCITDFQPQSGAVGTVVTLTGVGFQGATSVTFAGPGTPPTSVPAIFQIATDTQTTDTITATVPFGAVTGKITVAAPGGTATTATDFTVGVVVTDHARNISLKLKDGLTLKGKVTVPDGFTDCASGVPVKLQKKKKGGGWTTLKTVTTSDTGAYSGKVANKAGKYRSVAKKTTAGGETCLKAVSPTRKH